MNILILCTHLNPAGISRYVINLSKGLTKRGHNVYIGCGSGEWLCKLTAANIPYKLIPIKTKSICSIKIFMSLFSLIPFIRKEKIQIIHSNTRVTQYLGYLIHKFCHIPYISTFHGFHHPTFFRKLYKFSGLRTIAVSKAVKKHLSEDLKIDEGQIRVVYNGVDKEELREKRRTKIDYGFKESDVVIGVLGRISEEKGHLLAAEAFKLIAAQYSNSYFLVAGKGRLERELKLFFNLGEMKNRVRFLELEAKDFLDIPDLLLVPSKKEGFGYTIVEAFIKGVAVIGFNTGGIAEIIKDRENGLLFYTYDATALKNAIEEMIRNNDLRKTIIKRAKESANSFSLEKMALDTENVYREVK
ncbi:MAG: glycosyltransferase family 4 protein [Candidatus Omnitrophota bacterium]|nr:glycosyltransferase family 4 protein [Candidatus Omnitrophota bacterium]